MENVGRVEPDVGHLTQPVDQDVMHVGRHMLLVAEGVVGTGWRAALKELTDLWQSLDLGTPGRKFLSLLLLTCEVEDFGDEYIDESKDDTGLCHIESEITKGSGCFFMKWFCAILQLHYFNCYRRFCNVLYCRN